jgi:hypothetical protein
MATVDLFGKDQAAEIGFVKKVGVFGSQLDGVPEEDVVLDLEE